MPPALAAGRFLQGLILGAGLGAVYGFLHPLSRRSRTIADLLFLCSVFPVWLYFSFAVCRGDLGLGYLASLPLGGILFECTLGRLLRPVWNGFWRVVGTVFRGFRKFFKKIITFIKKLFASGEKMSTI